MNDDILLTVEIEATKSLPILNQEGELVFFYKTEKKEPGFAITEITRIFKKTSATDFYQDDIREKVDVATLSNNHIVSTIIGEQAFAEVEKYNSLFEKFKQFAFKKTNIGESEKLVAKELKKSFERIVPPSALRDIYYIYGKEMFEYINRID